MEPFKKGFKSLERKYIPKIKEVLDEKEEYLSQSSLF